MMGKIETINKYFRQLGVNENVINYMNKKNIYFISEVEQVLGEEFYKTPYGLSEEQKDMDNILKLKQGTENFRIFDNGGIWVSRVSDPKYSAQNKGFISISDDLRFDEIKTNKYISFENGMIVERVMLLKSCEINESNRYSYESIFQEITATPDLNNVVTKNTSYSSNTEGLPLEPLETKISIKQNGLSSMYSHSENVMYNTGVWELVCSGKTKSQRIVENLNVEKITSSKKFSLIKNSFIKKISSGSKKNLYEKLRSETLELMKSENLDEIIHSDFTMKGKNGDACTWTVERVTEQSREILSQIDLKIDDDFTKQVLEPLMVDYATTNAIIKGRINELENGLTSYRTFSTTNNVLTVNNISKEYAQYIDTEIKKVEPVIYQKQMEQNEKQRENENEYGYAYQKVNKKRNGFLNLLLLTSIVGFFAGFFLFIMISIFTKGM